ncbi:SPFH domain-containing protein [Streptomyces gobiensis]|uniref:SPFH domain-containing protein n=1 Tax=Streptomyces gobiensis TaxID=2875706 RepID=UPI001E3AFB81|nr:SPFH domain-containing protein [Streptomyces gobiensis]UGY91116.1 hypothetical protein test1122_04850 [Streptomyces gobiensis]
MRGHQAGEGHGELRAGGSRAATPVRVVWQDEGIPMGALFDDRVDDRMEAREAAVLPVASASPVDCGAAADEAGADTRPSEASRRLSEAGDPELVEHPGPTRPGWVAALVGLMALAGAGWQLWLGGGTRQHATPPWQWAVVGGWGVLAAIAFGGLKRGRVGSVWTLTLFGRYRGSVRRTGLVWINPVMRRRRVDVRLRHWRSEPMPAVDAQGVALRVVVLVVWRVRDTARALLTVEDHTAYLRERVEAALVRVLSRLPADAFQGDMPTLRDVEAVGEALTSELSAECGSVGIDVFSVQPTRIEYAPEVAAAMRRRRVAAIDAQHRDSVLTDVVDAVGDTVRRLTASGLLELDDYERKVLVKDLTVAFYTARSSAGEQSWEQ